MCQRGLRNNNRGGMDRTGATWYSGEPHPRAACAAAGCGREWPGRGTTTPPHRLLDDNAVPSSITVPDGHDGAERGQGGGSHREHRLGGKALPRTFGQDPRDSRSQVYMSPHPLAFQPYPLPPQPPPPIKGYDYPVSLFGHFPEVRRRVLVGPGTAG